MKAFLSSFILFGCAFASANDGGMAAIKASQIKMREEAYSAATGDRVLVRKIAKPHFVITIDGGEAQKLQKVLPSQVSVITAMHPELAKVYAESFKALGIYSLKSNEATAKVISINCSDAKLSDDGSQITKTGKSVCTISIDGVDSDEEARESFGDAQNFEPKVCK